MTQGVAYSRQGTAGDPTFNSAGFKDDVRAFFGSGTGLQELYIQPGKLTGGRLARAGRSREVVAGQRRRAGGHALDRRRPVEARSLWLRLVGARKGIVMLRNPDDNRTSSPSMWGGIRTAGRREAEIHAQESLGGGCGANPG